MQYNLEAEQSVLGSMLIDPDVVIPVVVDVLRSLDFHREDHGRIFRAMVSLYEEGQVIDVVTLSSHLEVTKELDVVGGAAYLTQLIRVCPTAAHYLHYAQLVLEVAAERRTLFALDESKRLLAEGHRVEEVLQQARVLLDTVEERTKVKPVMVPFEQALASYWNELEVGGEGQRVPFGFSHIDRLVGGLGPGDFCLLAGKPSVGKTTFVLQTVWNLGKIGIEPVAMFSVESSEQELAGRVLGYVTNTFSDAIRKGFVSEEKKCWLKQVGEEVRLGFLLREVHDLTPRSLDAALSVLTRQYLIRLVIVDYLHRMRAGRKVSSTLEEERIISGELKGLAVKYKLPVIANSQVRKGERTKEVPLTLEDLMGSSALGYDADVVVMLDWPGQGKVDHPRQFLLKAEVLKNRNGPTGIAWLMRGGQGQLADLQTLEEVRTKGPEGSSLSRSAKKDKKGVESA